MAEREPNTPTTAPDGLAALWAEASKTFETNGLLEGAYDAAFAVEKRVLQGEVQTAADATAKLQVVLRSLTIGPRADELDQAGLLDVIRWLGGSQISPRACGADATLLDNAITDLGDEMDRLDTAMQGVHDEAAVATLSDRRTAVDAMIRSAPCVTKWVALAQLESLRRDLDAYYPGDRRNVPPAQVVQRIADFVKGL